MQVLRQPVPLAPATAACIGAFDGLHLGHQALLRRARALVATPADPADPGRLDPADRLAPADPDRLAPADSGLLASTDPGRLASTDPGRLALVTFDPHPARILAPERAPRLLQSPGQRARVCAALGIDALVLLPFDRALADTSPEGFVQRLLIDGLRPAAVVIGADFRFGAGRRGGVVELADLLRPAGITVAVVDAVPVPGDMSPEIAKLSSSGIRAAVVAGQVEAARAMLGRWYSVEGVVVRGAGRGRKLGMRTANVDVGAGLLPRPGIYAGALGVVGGPGPWPAAISLGKNPTFVDDPHAPLVLEVHALEQTLGDSLYGATVEVAFAAWLRDEQRFTGPDALMAQISRDLAAVRPALDPAAMTTFASHLSPAP